MPLFGGSSASEAAATAASLSNMGLGSVYSPASFGLSSNQIISDNHRVVADAKYRSSQANRRFEEAVNNFFSPAMQVRDQLHDYFFGSGQLDSSAQNVYDSGRHVVGSGSGSGSSSIPVAASVNYIDAPLAEQYGMSAVTAYQEALANTAHQREMLDLQRAGLNPVLAARYSGAGIFSPDSMVTASGHSGSGGSGRSAKSISGPLPTLLGAIATMASGKTAVGAAVATAAEAILPAFTNNK